MTIPSSEHVWSLIDHLFTAIPALIGSLYWLRKRFKKAVAEAVSESIQPLADKVNEIYPWYQGVSKAFDGRANGKAKGVGLD